MAQQVYTAAGEATTQIAGNLPTSAPTATTLQGALKEAHGKVSESGTVTVEVSGACVITLYTFNPSSLKWLPPGSSSASNQKTFTGAGKDYFVARKGTLFFIKSDTGSITGYVDCDPVYGVSH